MSTSVMHASQAYHVSLSFRPPSTSLGAIVCLSAGPSPSFPLPSFFFFPFSPSAQIPSSPASFPTLSVPSLYTPHPVPNTASLFLSLALMAISLLPFLPSPSLPAKYHRPTRSATAGGVRAPATPFAVQITEGAAESKIRWASLRIRQRLTSRTRWWRDEYRRGLRRSKTRQDGREGGREGGKEGGTWRWTAWTWGG